MQILDHGYLTFIEGWGSDERIVEAARPLSDYWRAIPVALARGYRVDLDTGEVYGLSGSKLSTARADGQQYPTVRLYVDGFPRQDYTVHVHKVIAYVLWGWLAFDDGIEVRHLDGNPDNNRANNLALGSCSQNQLDKSPEVRHAAAKKARASQPVESFNAILSDEIASAVLMECNANRGTSGRVKRGVVKAIAKRYGVSPSTISLIGKGKTWKR